MLRPFVIHTLSDEAEPAIATKQVRSLSRLRER